MRISDWSSDVCSSDLPPLDRNAAVDHEERLFQVSDLKAFLQGEWSIERRVQDRRAAQDGRLSGAAAFTADGSGLLCRAEGRLAIGAPEGPAMQSYRYEVSTAPPRAVHSADGRLSIGRADW